MMIVAFAFFLTIQIELLFYSAKVILFFKKANQ